jgi:hypothetical protein
MGTVTDESGGALPGVTVTVTAPPGRTIAIVTDATGRYLTPWLAPGDYTVTFELSGFESSIVKSIRLDAAQTVVVDRQLALAALTETVQVTAPAPAPPAPPRPPPPPRPRFIPKDDDDRASVCGPRESPSFSAAVGRIVSHRDSERQLLGPGDLLRIDAGDGKGITVGQHLVVRRRFQTGDRNAAKKLQTFGEQTAALLQVVEIEPQSSVALVLYACGEITAGDNVEPYRRQPAFFAVAEGKPQYDEPAKIIIGEHGRNTAAAGQMMVIDRGIMQGVQRGQRLTIFRPSSLSPAIRLTIGDGVIVGIRADSATILIERATDAALVGDMVALHR